MTSRGLPPNGNLIRTLRKKNNLTQDGLARKCLCHKRTIENIEKGLVADTDTIYRIASVLGVSDAESLLITSEGDRAVDSVLEFVIARDKSEELQTVVADMEGLLKSLAGSFKTIRIKIGSVIMTVAVEWDFALSCIRADSHKALHDRGVIEMSVFRGSYSCRIGPSQWSLLPQLSHKSTPSIRSGAYLVLNDALDMVRTSVRAFISYPSTWDGFDANTIEGEVLDYIFAASSPFRIDDQRMMVLHERRGPLVLPHLTAKPHDFENYVGHTVSFMAYLHIPVSSTLRSRVASPDKSAVSEQNDELWGTIRERLKSFSSSDQQMFRLRFIEGWTVDQIAEELHGPTVKVLNRLRQLQEFTLKALRA